MSRIPSNNFPGTDSTDPADLRAALARARLPIYVVAARVRIHPVRLGAMLRERIPIPPGMAERILAAVRDEVGE